MKAYLTFTKKGLLLIVAALVCITLICGEIYVAGNQNTNAATNAERLHFIENIGCSIISDKPSAKTVTIPETFSDVYINYNSLQKSAGYDLTLYKGCEVTVYTYGINPPQNYSGECVCNLIVYNDRVIGGDISSVALGGFMLPIKKQI